MPEGAEPVVLAKRHGVVDNPRRVCLIPKYDDESNERGIAIIVVVLEVGPACIALGVTGDDEVARCIRTVFDWKTGLAAEGKLKELKLPPSELARIEEFDTQGSYE
jgi:hypothetical protein